MIQDQTTTSGCTFPNCLFFSFVALHCGAYLSSSKNGVVNLFPSWKLNGLTRQKLKTFLPPHGLLLSRKTSPSAHNFIYRHTRTRTRPRYYFIPHRCLQPTLAAKAENIPHIQSAIRRVLRASYPTEGLISLPTDSATIKILMFSLSMMQIQKSSTTKRLLSSFCIIPLAESSRRHPPSCVHFF